ncbi:MAG: PEP-utilizing enzyme [Patescibacteria group bacterium]|jgi:phosphohistidine swiveling domain-containing protein
MTLKKTLLELKKLMIKWGLSIDDWSLILHYADILQGYEIKYNRQEHLHIIINAGKIPWSLEGKSFHNETPVPPQTQYGKDFNSFIKKTGWDFHLIIKKPKFFKKLITNYSILYAIDNQKIRMLTPLGNLVFNKSEMPKWQKIFSEQILARRFIWVEGIYQKAKDRGDKAVVRLAGELIKKYRPKDKKSSKIKNNNFKFYKVSHSLKGEIGYGGKTRGRVFLIKNPDKVLKKIRKNFILVAKLTSPKLIMQIKNSKAVVTDEGGKLSHAAIICREFKIPCVTGTQIATQVFKDGDLVEVDANKGIIRKL